MFRRYIIPVIAALTLAACASTPVYRPSPAPNAAGYSETQVESNRFFVTYRAGGSADAQLLSDYALLRAAELTLQNGRDWFWVDRRTTDANAGAYSSGPSVGVSIGGGNFGRRSGVGGSVGLSFPIGGSGGARASAATLEIRFGEGVKPDNPNTYDAHAVSANLRSRLMTTNP